MSMVPLVKGTSLKRNILHIVADDMRTSLGFYGHPEIHTPHLDALAAKSLVFENAYCQQPICSPSRNSFMTGLTPNHTKAYNFINYFREARPDAVSLPQYFKQQPGYVAYGAGKLYHTSNPPNHDEPKSWSPEADGSQTYFEPTWHHCPKGHGSTFCLNDTLPEQEDYQTYLHTVRHLEMAKNASKNFYVGCGFHRPHAPYISPHSFYAPYANAAIPAALHRTMDPSVPDIAMIVNFGIGLENGTRYKWDPQHAPVPVEVQLAVRKHYYTAISFVDSLVGLLLADLQRLGLADSTVIIFHADHGYFMGESGEWEKKMLFENTARVPLLIHDPAHPVGRRTTELAELVDVYPTAAALAGLPPPARLDGVDLSPVVRGRHEADPPLKTAAFSQYPRCPPHDNLDVVQQGACFNNPGTSFGFMGFAVRTQDWRYVEWRRWNPHHTSDVNDAVADWSAQGLVELELYNCTGRTASKRGVFDIAERNLAHSFRAERQELAQLLRTHFI